MYGLVNQAIEDLSLQLGGPALWAQIRQGAGVDIEAFVGMQAYPDDETMGTTLPDFLGNLDAMHARITLSMPELRPPSFVCETLPDGTLTVQYWSDRDGLAPMVRGLLIGLGEMFDSPVSVTQSTDRASGADYDEFLVAYLPDEPVVDPDVLGPLVGHAL
jgi:hypothetical protein